MMRSILIIGTIISLLFVSCDKGVEKVDYLAKITYKSKASFYRTLEEIDWNDITPVDPSVKDANQPCYPKVLEVLENLPNIEVNREDATALLRIYMFPLLVEQDVEKGYYTEIQGAGIKLIPQPIQDRILRKIDIGLNRDDFVDQVKGDGNISPQEEVKLEMLYMLYHETLNLYSARFLDRNSIVNNCIVRETIDVKLDSVFPNQQKISFKVLKQAMITCECSDDADESDVDNATYNLESTIYASYADKGLLNLLFSESTEPVVTFLYVDCCSEKEPDSNDEHNESEKADKQEGK